MTLVLESSIGNYRGVSYPRSYEPPKGPCGVKRVFEYKCKGSIVSRKNTYFFNINVFSKCIVTVTNT